MKKEFCPDCGREMKVYTFWDEFSVVMKCNHCEKAFKYTYDNKTFPSNIRKFNWAAFLAWPLWGFFNGKRLLSIFGVFFLGPISRAVPPIGFVYLIIAFYMGGRGNRISWINKDWISAKRFEEYQKDWTIGVIITLIGLFILSVVTMAYFY